MKHWLLDFEAGNGSTSEKHAPYASGLDLCENTLDVFRMLGAMARSPDNGIGSLNEILDKASSGFTCHGKEKGSLFPISPKGADAYFVETCTVCDVSIREAVFNLSSGVVRGLNFLYCAGWSTNPIVPESLGPVNADQAHTLLNIFKAAANFACVETTTLELSKEQQCLHERRISYTGESVSVRQDLVAELVIPAWPKIGCACVAQ